MSDISVYDKLTPALMKSNDEVILNIVIVGISDQLVYFQLGHRQFAVDGLDVLDISDRPGTMVTPHSKPAVLKIRAKAKIISTSDVMAGELATPAPFAFRGVGIYSGRIQSSRETAWRDTVGYSLAALEDYTLGTSITDSYDPNGRLVLDDQTFDDFDEEMKKFAADRTYTVSPSFSKGQQDDVFYDDTFD